jgi:uncharacterized protein YkwD
MRRLVVLLATAATMVALVGGAAASSTAKGKTAEQKYEAQAFGATNANRTHNGLKALRPDDCLQHAAVRQAKLMAQREEIFHQDLNRVLRDCKLNTAGENVAYGFPTGRSVVDDGWMKSEGHRANILNSSFTLMGVGARQGHDGSWYVSQVFGRKA